MPAPSNQSCATATVIPSLPYFNTVDASLSGTDTSLSGGGCFKTPNAYYNAVWYRYTATAHDVETPLAKILVAQAPGNGPFILTVYKGSCGALVEVGCSSFTANNSIVPLTAELGVTFYFLVSSRFAGQGVAQQHFSLISLQVHTCDVPDCTPIPVVEGLTLDCTNAQLLVIGGSFAADANVIITRDGELVTPTSIVSQTDSQIVVQLPDNTSGEYCAFVSNPEEA